MKNSPSFIQPGESRRRQMFYLSKSKLGVVTQVASFMGGFCVKSVANLQVNPDPNEGLLTAYVVITTLLVTFTSFAILVALWIMPLLYTAELINDEVEDILHRASPQKLESFDLQRFSSIVNLARQDSRTHARTTSHGLKTFRTNRLTVLLIEASWILVGTISTFLFTLDVIVMNWIKYEMFGRTGPLICTILLLFAMVGLSALGLYFRFYVVDKFKAVTKNFQQEFHKEGNTQDYDDVEENNGDPRAVVWWPHHNVPSIPASIIYKQQHHSVHAV